MDVQADLGDILTQFSFWLDLAAPALGALLAASLVGFVMARFFGLLSSDDD